MLELNEYIIERDYDNTVKLADAYERIGQLAAAVSYYLEALSLTEEWFYQYNCLVKIALIYEKQGDRLNTVITTLLKAVAINRGSAACFHLARIYNDKGEYHLAYSFTKEADLIYDTNEYLEYPGYFGLIFEKGRAAWWIGYHEESREYMYGVLKDRRSTPKYVEAAKRNLRSIGYPKVHYQLDITADWSVMRWPIKGLSEVAHNYSQSMQDIFALTVTKGKSKGSYLEIGSADPIECNNTYLLEKYFGWKGISIDIDDRLCNKFRLLRENKCYTANALEFDYSIVYEQFGHEVDYLQVDCEPSNVSLMILKKVLTDTDITFKCITFEHDGYLGGTAMEESRKFLQERGYVLAVPNVHFDETGNYEDWWIHNSVLKDYSMVSRKDKNIPREYFLR